MPGGGKEYRSEVKGSITAVKHLQKEKGDRKKLKTFHNKMIMAAPWISNFASCDYQKVLVIKSPRNSMGNPKGLSSNIICSVVIP